MAKIAQELQRRLMGDAPNILANEEAAILARVPDFGFTVRVIPPVLCVDGSKISVQASLGHNCTPRKSEGPWTAVEVWYPDEDHPTGYEPLEKVAEWIAGHGGIA